MTDATLSYDQTVTTAMKAVSAIGRDIQPGVASALKVFEGIGSVLTKPEVVLGLDRIGRDIQPGVASALKVFEGIGSVLSRVKFVAQFRAGGV